MGNLSNVAMDTCAMCGEVTGILLQSREGKDAFDGKRKVCSGGICDKCQKTIDENVSLLCDTCKGLVVVAIDAFSKDGRGGPEFKPGEKFRIYKCPKCSGEEGKFIFTPDTVVGDL